MFATLLSLQGRDLVGSCRPRQIPFTEYRSRRTNRARATIRVLIVNKYAHVTGGADQNCLAILESLRGRGHHVSMLSTNSADNVVTGGFFIEPNVTHQSRATLARRERLAVLGSAVWNPAAAAGMRHLLRSFRPDVVHLHKLYPQLSVAPAVIARRAGIPVVQTLHDYELLSASALDHTGGWLDREEEKLSYRTLNTATFPLRRGIHARAVSAFIACSRFVADRYRPALKTAPTVLPYFVEAGEREPPRFSERKGAIFVGRLTEEKGVHDVLQLAAALKETPVTIVGYGPIQDAVVQAQRRLPNVRFLGRQSRAEIRELLVRSRVFLMPSRWQEPGGIAALEAMAVGTPVVAYANGGLAEYVSDAGGGLAVAPSVESLIDSVRHLYDEEGWWEEYSLQGLEGVARLHTDATYLPRLEEIYAAAVR